MVPESCKQLQFVPNNLTNQQVPKETNLNSTATSTDPSPAVSFSPEVILPATTTSGRRVTIPLRFR